MATWTTTRRLALSKTFRVVAVAAVACTVGTPGVQQCAHAAVLGRHTAPAQAARGCHRRHRHLRLRALNCYCGELAGCAVPLRCVGSRNTVPSASVAASGIHLPALSRPRFQPRWPRNPRNSGPRRLAASTLPSMPRLRVWLQPRPFHDLADRSGDYLCRLPTRVFVPAFFVFG